MVGVFATAGLSAVAEAMPQTYPALAVFDLFRYRLCVEV
jgi:hypothetical protein